MWVIGKTEKILHTPIWDVKSTEKSFNGKTGNFVSLEAPDWVKAVIYRKDTQEWVMVHEFRQGVDKMLYEFPSGTVEKGESAYNAALREMTEETGYSEEQIDYFEPVYEGNPNPAFMNNHMTCFLFVVNGEPSSPRKLDEFEDVKVIFTKNPSEYIDWRNGAIADQYAYMLASKAIE